MRQFVHQENNLPFHATYHARTAVVFDGIILLHVQDLMKIIQDDNVPHVLRVASLDLVGCLYLDVRPLLPQPPVRYVECCFPVFRVARRDDAKHSLGLKRFSTHSTSTFLLLEGWCLGDSVPIAFQLRLWHQFENNSVRFGHDLS